MFSWGPYQWIRLHLWTIGLIYIFTQYCVTLGHHTGRKASYMSWEFWVTSMRKWYWWKELPFYLNHVVLQVEQYKAEIKRLQESEAQIKALSVNYAALLKEREVSICFLGSFILFVKCTNSAILEYAITCVTTYAMYGRHIATFKVFLNILKINLHYWSPHIYMLWK